MNKRKIDVNQIKKGIVKGKKYRTINVKYEVVLSYFKQKQVKQLQIFQVTFMPLIQDMLCQLLSAQLISKLQQQSKQGIKPLTIAGDNLRLQSFHLKSLSKQYPIQQICECLFIQKVTDQKVLGIHKNKLMIFFKKLRLIYADFCYCVGEKCILEDFQLKNFYQVFKSEWSKREEKGRLSEKDKLQKKICRTLFFLGVLIQNNIYQAIQNAQRKKRQQTDDLGTKSQKKKNIKGITQNQSSTYSFGSTDLMSNFSVRLKSQKSNEDDFITNYPHKNPYNQYSQKSQRIISKSKYGLWDKIELKSMQFKVSRTKQSVQQQSPKYQINYLSNDVQNILIEQAFKMQRLKCSSPYPYYYINYPQYYQAQIDYTQMNYQQMNQLNQSNQYNQGNQVNNYYVNTIGQFHDYCDFNNGNYGNNGNSNNSYANNTYANWDNMQIDQEQDDVNRLGRSFDFYNLVQTRKNMHRFTTLKKTNNNNK